MFVSFTLTDRKNRSSEPFLLGWSITEIGFAETLYYFNSKSVSVCGGVLLVWHPAWLALCSVFNGHYQHGGFTAYRAWWVSMGPDHIGRVVFLEGESWGNQWRGYSHSSPKGSSPDRNGLCKTQQKGRAGRSEGRPTPKTSCAGTSPAQNLLTFSFWFLLC